MHHRTFSPFLLLLAGAALATPLAGQQPPRLDTLPDYVLGTVVVEGRIDDLTQIATSASQGRVGAADLRLRPLSREAELLETVPGFIATQHSGDGKGNQMFVRGFNLDHGTDFLTRVEGMPVNIPTHAHGQGYTDLNFLIPELVDYVEYQLGTYYAEVGDFGSAGGAHFRLRRSLPRPLFSTGVGANGFARLVAAGSTPLAGGDLLAAGEWKGYDGPWDRPQDLQKKSGMLRYSAARGSNTFSILGLGFTNRWDSSDQIPRRLVESGAIGRFGQVDSTLAGETSRTSLTGSWARAGAETQQRVELYGIGYDLDLYGNFTYFLEDEEDGDQVLQRDRGRRVLGANLLHVQPVRWLDREHVWTAGLQARQDRADVALYRTRGGVIGSTVRRDEVDQLGVGLHLQAESRWTPHFRTILGLRGDRYTYDVTSDLAANSGEADDAILSPKLSLIFGPWAGTEVYASAGTGFHSNDARGAVQRVDPASGDPVDPLVPLVPSRGAEIGVRATPREGWRSTLAVWAVELDSELIFVGDAGSTEASDGSRRVGVTFANYYRVTPRLSADVDLSFTGARFLDVDPGQDRIPGSLNNVVAAGVSWEPEASGIFGALRLRHLGSYALIEDNSVRADPTTILNLNGGYRLGNLGLSVNLLNLLDSKDADIQYFYESRLPGEMDPVEDVHFHPVEPRQLRITLSWGL
jgi:hypothetical protein